MNSYAEHFRAAIEGFLARSGMKPTEFSRQATGDPSFLLELRRGRSCTLALADRVIRFIRTQKETNSE